MSEFGFNNLQRGLTDEQRENTRERLSAENKQIQQERALAEINKFDSNPNNGFNWGEMFGGLLNVVEVVAKKPTATQPQPEKPNYTPYIVGALAVLLLLLVLKK